MSSVNSDCSSSRGDIVLGIENYVGQNKVFPSFSHHEMISIRQTSTFLVRLFPFFLHI